VRLSLENLNIRRNRDNAHLFTAPYFENGGFENGGGVAVTLPAGISYP
jgi:hypothetical protein